MSTSNTSDLFQIAVDDTTESLDPFANMEDLSPMGYAIAAVVLFFIMVFGVCNNLVVIVVVAGTRKLRTPMNLILLNLSISDFLISALGTPLSFAAAVNRRWIFGDALCQVYAFSMTLTGKISDFSFVLFN
ncbi:hypothetical protein JTE90_004287 [Oedothorax gibbosus]|uniref:G-protein coupled receptors family 1 profile domain-containing protein n=1 Tax=Oedothorax gibbosus TaxID=931172 RepID=A0AAV6VLT5_9ARAC|nr:hypothetical protein JTE90_004287 [Oedothorax gibbosus]